jgi:uridine kinase
MSEEPNSRVPNRPDAPTARQAMLEALAERIAARRLPHPLRVAIDGVDAAGKTTLADELVGPIAARGRPVIRASIDGFHRPRSERLQRGPDSPESYYHDSFDYPALRAALLLPLGPSGDRRYHTAVFDFRMDQPVTMKETEAPADAVLLFDGLFLLRPELDDCWDFRVFIDVPFEIVLRRAIRRDLALFGSAGAVEQRYLRRYLPGQRLYFAAIQPWLRADVVVEHSDPAHPTLSLREG